MRLYFDSSALAKRYIEEPGSDDVVQLCLQATELAVSVLCIPEIISALCRLRKEGHLTSTLYREAKEALLGDLGGAEVCSITSAVVGQSVQLLEANRLRALDALQIGCALEWMPDAFVSSDRRQIDAASAAGLHVITV